MNGMNRVVLMGHLNEDPTPGATAKGKKLTVFHIATNEFIKSADGEKIKRTDNHKITTYGKTADACEKMLRKGSMVLVEGKIRNMANKNDTKSSYEILATDVSFIANYSAKEQRKVQDGN